MSTKRSATTEWKQVGSIGVDSGQVMVGDPCYFLYRQKPDEYLREATGAKNWLELCEYKRGEQERLDPRFPDKQAINIAEWCVISPTYSGDGAFPVYVQVERATGRVKALKVVFQ